MTVSKQALIDSGEKLIELMKENVENKPSEVCCLADKSILCAECPCYLEKERNHCSNVSDRKEWLENWLSENKPKTITKEETEKSNNGQTNHTRLDKILDNINSLEHQKDVIQIRIESSENQLQCKSGDELLCEYLNEIGKFSFTDEGKKLENIHLVRDFIDSLLKVEEV